MRFPWLFSAAWLLVLGLQILNRASSTGVVLAMLLLAAVICIGLARGNSGPSVRPFADRTWLAAVILICAVHLTYAGLHLRKANILDIGLTTLRAGEVMVEGGNPYVANIDRQAVESLSSTQAPIDPERFRGYKYRSV